MHIRENQPQDDCPHVASPLATPTPGEWILQGSPEIARIYTEVRGCPSPPPFDLVLLHEHVMRPITARMIVPFSVPAALKLCAALGVIAIKRREESNLLASPKSAPGIQRRRVAPSLFRVHLDADGYRHRLLNRIVGCTTRDAFVRSDIYIYLCASIFAKVLEESTNHRMLPFLHI